MGWQGRGRLPTSMLAWCRRPSLPTIGTPPSLRVSPGCFALRWTAPQWQVGKIEQRPWHCVCMSDERAELQSSLWPLHRFGPCIQVYFRNRSIGLARGLNGTSTNATPYLPRTADRYMCLYVLRLRPYVLSALRYTYAIGDVVLYMDLPRCHLPQYSRATPIWLPGELTASCVWSLPPSGPGCP